jgi:hypothetical protein
MGSNASPRPGPSSGRPCGPALPIVKPRPGQRPAAGARRAICPGRFSVKHWSLPVRADLGARLALGPQPPAAVLGAVKHRSFARLMREACVA